MKTEAKWLKLARRTALVVMSACCVMAMTGCDGDDDDPSPSGGQWYLTITIQGETETEVISMPGDLNVLQDGTYSFNDDGMDIIATISGNSITINANGSDESFTMEGTVESSTSMSGTMIVSVPGQGTFSGTWSMSNH